MKTKLLLTLMILFGSLCIQNGYVEARVDSVPPGYIIWHGDIGAAYFSTIDGAITQVAIPVSYPYISYTISSQIAIFTIDKLAWIADGCPPTLEVTVCIGLRKLVEITLIPPQEL